jgi:hypothetical protein
MHRTKKLFERNGFKVAVALAPLFGGCALEVPGEGAEAEEETKTEGDIASSEHAITSAGQTIEAPWVVELSLPKLNCSGIVLTEHYILTAGHCVEGYSSTKLLAKVRRTTIAGHKETIYEGDARILKNPQFHEHQWFGDPGQDVGLLKLDGAGVNLAITGRAKLWGSNHPDINHDPWEQSSQNRWFTVIGWGQGGSSNCLNGTNGVKRIGYGFVVDTTGPDANHVTAPSNTTHLCPGDSGSPWIFVRGGQLIAFAISGQTFPDLIIAGDFQRAALIKPKRQWMYEVSVPTGVKLICAGAGFAGTSTFGVTYEECREQIVPPPQPPPGPGCPSGQRCCEPVSPTVCGRCLPNNLQCE